MIHKKILSYILIVTLTSCSLSAQFVEVAKSDVIELDNNSFSKPEKSKYRTLTDVFRLESGIVKGGAGYYLIKPAPLVENVIKSIVLGYYTLYHLNEKLEVVNEKRLEIELIEEKRVIEHFTILKDELLVFVSENDKKKKTKSLSLYKYSLQSLELIGAPKQILGI